MFLINCQFSLPCHLRYSDVDRGLVLVCLGCFYIGFLRACGGRGGFVSADNGLSVWMSSINFGGGVGSIGSSFRMRRFPEVLGVILLSNEVKS